MASTRKCGKAVSKTVKEEPMPSRFRVRINWNAETHPGFTFVDPHPVVMQYRNGVHPDSPLTRKKDIYDYFEKRIQSRCLFAFPQFALIGGMVYMREGDVDKGVTVSYMNIMQEDGSDVSWCYIEGVREYMKGMEEVRKAMERMKKKKLKNLPRPPCKCGRNMV